MSELDLAELISRNVMPNFVRIGEDVFGIAFGAHHDGTNWIADKPNAIIILADLAPNAAGVQFSTAPISFYEDTVLTPGQVFTPSLKMFMEKFQSSYSAMYLTGPAGSTRNLRFATGTSTRWQLQTNAGAESGGNVGSDLGLVSYDDAGAVLRTILTITRLGVLLVNNNVTWKQQGTFYPPKDSKLTQTNCALYAGSGAPNNANGADGDIYFRADGGALTTVYQKRVGVWTGIV